MSWKDNYTRDLIITCGDGETFTCYTLPSFSKEVEYNTTEFNFIDIDIPLIKKTTIANSQIPLEFFFINDDHIEQTKSFLFSASNPAPWTITHPYYDTVLVQVSSIKIDDSDGNITKITCTAKQTLGQEGITVNTSAVDVIMLKQVELNTLLTVEPDLTPTITNINSVQKTTEKNYKSGVKIITNPIDSENYFNAFNTVNSYVNTITQTPIQAINALTNIILLPAQFEAKVQDRIRVLQDAMDNLRSTIIGLTTVTAKKLFAIQSISTLGAICTAAASPLTGDYTNANNAITIADAIKGIYKTFLTDIDGIQGANGGNPLSFIPDFNAMAALNSLVNLTLSSLFDIALAGRKEYVIVLAEDSDYLLLTHQFYGLDSQDNNIDEFIANNNLNWREVALGLPKGKTIIYYA